MCVVFMKNTGRIVLNIGHDSLSGFGYNVYLVFLLVYKLLILKKKSFGFSYILTSIITEETFICKMQKVGTVDVMCN